MAYASKLPYPLSYNSDPRFSAPFGPVSRCSSISSSRIVASGDFKQKRGAFILLEGLDRSGKTTQSEMLVEFLNKAGHKAVLLRFPDRNTPTGRKISAYLKNTVEVDDKEIHLLFTENRREKMEEMVKLIQEGVTLVVDRYSFSGVAFSAAKGLNLDWCKMAEQNLPAPDVVFYLDIPVEFAAKRGGYGEERYEKIEFQKAVASQYKKLKDDTWQVIDARQTIDEVHRELSRAAMHMVEDSRLHGATIRHMWSASA